MRVVMASATAFAMMSSLNYFGYYRPVAAFLAPARSRGAPSVMTRAAGRVASLSSKHKQLSHVEACSSLLHQTRGEATRLHHHEHHSDGKAESHHQTRRRCRSPFPARAASSTKTFVARRFPNSFCLSARSSSSSDEAPPSPGDAPDNQTSYKNPGFPAASPKNSAAENGLRVLRIGRGGAFFWSKVFKNIIGGGSTGDHAAPVSEAVAATRPAAGEIAVSQGGGVASAGGKIDTGAEAGVASARSEGAATATALVGTGDEQGPKWVPPKWASDVHPAVQAAASVLLYFFHMLCLSKGSINFPIQLIPNSHGLTQSVGMDTAAGFGILGAAWWVRRKAGMPLLPPLRGGRVPWGWNGNQVKKRLPVTFCVLIMAYLFSGWGSQLCEYVLYLLTFAGINMSVAMHRSALVLMSHMMWVLMGVRILGMALKPFFNRQKGSWVGMKWKSNWLWWVIGGYYVSAALFNMADLVNQFACPLPPDTESVVSKIINPEDNDVMAMAVGSIAPCISAPWWEEVLYRGFLLPALALYLPLKAAVPTGSLLFAAHHMNLQAMFPLSVLGLIWSLLYIYSNNLLVTVIIHAMWNSRVFLGSLLGL